MRKDLIPYTLLFAFFIAIQSCKKDSSISSHQVTHESIDDLDEDLAVTDPSLLCYLPFRGNLKDKSGHGNDGVLKGSITYVSDRFGNASKAISFGASNSYIEIPEAQFVGLESGTIALDFYATSSSRQVLVSKMSYDQPFDSPRWYQSFVLVADPGISTPLQYGSKQNGYCSAPDGWNPTLNSTTGFTLNQWNHLAVTFNSSIGNIYLNGNIVGSSTRLSSPICQGEPIRLGIWWQTDPLFFTGNMDEVRIYNRVLTAREIKRLSAK